MPKIIAGSASLKIAKSLSKNLGIPIAECSGGRYNDGEVNISLSENLHDDIIIIVQGSPPPVNDNLIELLLLIDAANEAGARQIIVLAPYLSYMRADNALSSSYPAAKTISKLLQSAGASLLMTLDAHSPESLKYFKLPVVNIDPTEFYAKIAQSLNLDIVIAPDQGSEERAKNLASALGKPYGVINKVRASNKTSLHASKINVNANLG